MGRGGETEDWEPKLKERSREPLWTVGRVKRKTGSSSRLSHCNFKSLRWNLQTHSINSIATIWQNCSLVFISLFFFVHISFLMSLEMAHGQWLFSFLTTQSYARYKFTLYLYQYWTIENIWWFSESRFSSFWKFGAHCTRRCRHQGRWEHTGGEGPVLLLCKCTVDVKWLCFARLLISVVHGLMAE